MNEIWSDAKIYDNTIPNPDTNLKTDSPGE